MKNYTAERFYRKISDHFNDIFGASYYFGLDADAAYITADSATLYRLPSYGPFIDAGGAAISNSTIPGFFADVCHHATADALDAVSGLLPPCEFRRGIRVRRFTVPAGPGDVRAVYVAEKLLKMFPASTRFLFNPRRPEVLPILAALPDETGDLRPVAVVMPLRVFGGQDAYFKPAEDARA